MRRVYDDMSRPPQAPGTPSTPHAIQTAAGRSLPACPPASGGSLSVELPRGALSLSAWLSRRSGIPKEKRPRLWGISKQTSMPGSPQQANRQANGKDSAAVDMDALDSVMPLPAHQVRRYRLPLSAIGGSCSGPRRPSSASVRDEAVVTWQPPARAATACGENAVAAAARPLQGGGALSKRRPVTTARFHAADRSRAVGHPPESRNPPPRSRGP